MTVRITHRGLTELPSELDAAAQALSAGADRLEVDLADQVAGAARRNAERGKLTGRAGDSIRSQGPTVTAGGGVPWYGTADFGGYRRPYVRGGRWIGPAVREVGVLKEAEQTLDRALGDLR